MCGNLRNGMFTKASKRHLEWPRACVFDCDGLLLDSTATWNAAFLKAADAVGAAPHDVDLEALLGASVGSGASALSLQLGAEITEGALRTALTAAMSMPLE